MMYNISKTWKYEIWCNTGSNIIIIIIIIIIVVVTIFRFC